MLSGVIPSPSYPCFPLSVTYICPLSPFPFPPFDVSPSLSYTCYSLYSFLFPPRRVECDGVRVVRSTSVLSSRERRSGCIRSGPLVVVCVCLLPRIVQVSLLASFSYYLVRVCWSGCVCCIERVHVGWIGYLCVARVICVCFGRGLVVDNVRGRWMMGLSFLRSGQVLLR